MPIRTESGLKLTYEDYVKIPDDGRRHEIIDGRHIVNPAPQPRHQIILGKLYQVIVELERAGRAQPLLSPIDVHLSDVDIVQPDLIAVATKNEHLIGEQRIEGPPELVVEILSPSTRRLDRGAKRVLYESAGVLEYWIVDPDEKTLCQHTLIEGRYSETRVVAGEVRSSAFVGLRFDLASIF